MFFPLPGLKDLMVRLLLDMLQETMDGILHSGSIWTTAFFGVANAFPDFLK